MSAILATIGPSPDAPSEDRMVRLLEMMSHRGRAERAVHGWASGALAAVRDPWEAKDDVGGPTMVGQSGPVRTVCDATLYYKDDLVRALDEAGAHPESRSAADLIAAAYRVWGVDCTSHLEGDFAFCVWDPERSRLFAARDVFGVRTLFYCVSGGRTLVASTPHPIRSFQGPDRGVDLEGVLRGLLLRPGDGSRTASGGVFELPAAHAMTIDSAGPTTKRYWVPRADPRWAGLSIEEAPGVLASILERSTEERLGSGACGLSMSGGMDSTAILASAGAAGRASDVDVVSLRYADGDPGDESDYVQAVADHYNRPVRWVRAGDVEFFEDLLGRAQLRSHCHGHVFEGFNRALAKTAVGAGSRIMLNGHGGDNVFAVADWLMPDLVRRGRLLRLRRYARERGYSLRSIMTHAIRPALPLWVYDSLESVLGRRICSRPIERPAPGWLTADPELVRAISRDDRLAYARDIVQLNPTIVARRRAWLVADASFTRANGDLFDVNRSEGVELRFPFYDRRLVEFSLALHAEVLNQPGRMKVALGEAMRGRLPERHRQAQKGGLKPGTAIGLMTSRWVPATRGLLESLGPDWELERLGVVDRTRLVAALEDQEVVWTSAGDISVTPSVEVWLRASTA